MKSHLQRATGNTQKPKRIIISFDYSERMHELEPLEETCHRKLSKPNANTVHKSFIMNFDQITDFQDNFKLKHTAHINKQSQIVKKSKTKLSGQKSVF